MFIFKGSDPEKLIKKYFSFLVDQYGLAYSPYCYSSDKLKIIHEPGHKSPRIFITKAGEPDFIRLGVERILEYLGQPDLQIDYTMHSLEQNIIFISKVFQKYASKIIHEIDDWWLPVHKRQYLFLEEYYKKNDQVDDFQYSYRGYYEYLKSKGVHFEGQNNES